MTIAASKHIEMLDRRTKVASLRLAGIRDQSKIAAQLGVSQPTIHRDFKALNAEWRERALADVAHEKGIDLDRLERMIAALWPQVVQGHLGAIDRVTRLLERKARLLGLDAPEQLLIDQQTMTTVVMIVAPEGGE